MNIRDLRYLVAVAKYKHFGKAAKASYVSQPALSMQLKKLEETLGVTVFERSNKSVMTTAIGERLVEKAQQVLQAADDMLLLAKTFQDPQAGEIRLGAFPTLAPYLLPKAMPKIIKLFPKLKLLLLEEKTGVLIEKLKIGDIDAAFLALPFPKEEESLHCEFLFKEPFYIALPKSHRLAKLKQLTRKDIKDEKLLLLDEGHCLRKQALDVCELTGAVEQQDFRATSLETLREMVAANVGMTLVPELAVPKKDARIVYLPFCDHQYSRTIALVWRKTSVRSELLKKLVKNVFTS
jgi:LysR family transcriptional regulator, hydrogen peroxide-inducible genes activator